MPEDTGEQSWFANVVDAYAKRGKMSGVLLQGIMKTQGYQDQVAERAFEREQRRLQLENLRNANTRSQLALQYAQEDRPAEIRMRDANAATAENNQGISANRLLLSNQQKYNNDARQVMSGVKNYIENNSALQSLPYPVQQMAINSPEMKDLQMAAVLLDAFGKSDEQGNYLLKQYGWEMTTKNGRRQVVSPNNRIFELDDNSVNSILGEVRSNMENVIKTAAVYGPATSMGQVTFRKDLDANAEKFGSFGRAAKVYKEMIANGLKDGSYTRADLVGHWIAQTIQGATADGIIDKEEQAVIAPQFVQGIQYLGGKIDPNSTLDDLNSVKVTFVGNNYMTLHELQKEFSVRDKIARDFAAAGESAYQSRLAKAKKNLGGGDNPNNAEKPVFDDEAIKQRDQLYGQGFLKVPKEAYPLVKRVEDLTMKKAEEMGILYDGRNASTKTKEGKPQPISDVTLKKIAETERNIYSQIPELAPIAENGPWQQKWRQREKELKTMTKKNKDERRKKAIDKVARDYWYSRGNFGRF